MKTLVLIGGKTLGHVTPGLAVVNELHKKYPLLRIIYITTSNQKGLKILNNSKIDKVIYFDLNIKGTFSKITNTLKYYQRFQKIYKLYRPIGIISFGSFLGTIAVYCGRKMGIKTIIHEQNAVMGFGNKLVFKKVDLVLSNFEIKNKNKKIKVVGNPILLENKVIKLNKNPQKLVITSGSQGAESFVKLGIQLYQDNVLNEFDVTFITGKKYFDEVSKVINSKKGFKIVPFIENLSDFLIDTTYIISRAGSTTLSEINYLKILPIIIPSPNVTNNHQYYNALEYDNAEVILEKDLSINRIKEALNKLKLKTVIDKKTNATLKFIEEVENVIKLC